MVSCLRRRLLAGTGVCLSIGVGGCLDRLEPDNEDPIQLRITADGMDPDHIELATATSYRVVIKNTRDQLHELAGPFDETPTLVPKEETVETTWTAPNNPGQYDIECQSYGEQLMTVDVGSDGPGPGCPVEE